MNFSRKLVFAAATVCLFLLTLVAAVVALMQLSSGQGGEAALSLGATPFDAWRLVTLPLAIPGVLAAAVLCFILTMNAYATPVLLGGPRFQMMAPVVANEVLNQNNWPFGGALAFMLMAVTLLLTIIANVVVARRYAR